MNESAFGNMFCSSIRAKALSYRFGGNVTQPFRVDPGRRMMLTLSGDGRGSEV
jgi:hypothetical protein